MVSLDLLQKQHNGHLISACCQLLANALTAKSLLSENRNSQWKTLIDLGLRNRLPEVQETAAGALKVVSSLMDLTDVIKR